MPPGPLPSVRLAPDPVLSVRCAEVDPRAPDVVALGDALVAVMRASPGCVGVAAPQIGAASRVFCLDVGGHRKTRSCAGLLVLANPVLVAADGREPAREGCLSVPDLTGDVVRATTVVVRAEAVGSGDLVEVHTDAFEARALQHELDHLDGLLFLDRVTGAGGLHARKRYR